MDLFRPKDADRFPVQPRIRSPRARTEKIGASHSPFPSASTPSTNAAYLAHDARNWLMILEVYCDLLRTASPNTAEYGKWMDELSGAVERGRGLVNSLLDSVAETRDMSGNDAENSGELVGEEGRQPSAILHVAQQSETSLNLSTALARRLPLLRQMAGREIQVEISAPSNAGEVAISENAFERILHNLVGNAMEAMPGGGQLRIKVRPGRRSDDRSRGFVKVLLLSVEDTGTGIDPRDLPYIFKAGVSGKRAQAAHPEQRGFGLAIVRKLTEGAGGKVFVRSRPGHGSCFQIELPLVGKTRRKNVSLPEKGCSVLC